VFDTADGVLSYGETCDAQSRLTDRRHRRCCIVGADLSLETQPGYALVSKLAFNHFQRPQNREREDTADQAEANLSATETQRHGSGDAAFRPASLLRP
jgi:hypothetical protein